MLTRMRAASRKPMNRLEDPADWSEELRDDLDADMVAWKHWYMHLLQPKKFDPLTGGVRAGYKEKEGAAPPKVAFAEGAWDEMLAAVRIALEWIFGIDDERVMFVMSDSAGLVDRDNFNQVCDDVFVMAALLCRYLRAVFRGHAPGSLEFPETVVGLPPTVALGERRAVPAHQLQRIELDGGGMLPDLYGLMKAVEDVDAQYRSGRVVCIDAILDHSKGGPNIDFGLMKDAFRRVRDGVGNEEVEDDGAAAAADRFIVIADDDRADREEDLRLEQEGRQMLLRLPGPAGATPGPAAGAAPGGPGAPAGAPGGAIGYSTQAEIDEELAANQAARDMVVRDVSELGTVGQVRLAERVHGLMVEFDRRFDALSSVVLRRDAGDEARVKLARSREVAAELRHALDRAIAEGGRPRLADLDKLTAACEFDAKDLKAMRSLAAKVVALRGSNAT